MKQLPPAYTPCRRPWCMRRAVYHRAPTECMPIELMAHYIDALFGTEPNE